MSASAAVIRQAVVALGDPERAASSASRVVLRVAQEDTRAQAVYRSCGFWPMFLGCGLVSLGAVHQGEAQPPHGTQDAFYAGLGARAGVEFPLGLGNRLALRLLGDGLVNLTRPAVYGNDQRLWRVFPVAGALGGRLLVTF